MKYLYAILFVIESAAALVLVYAIAKASHFGVAMIFVVVLIMALWAMFESYSRMKQHGG